MSASKRGQVDKEVETLLASIDEIASEHATNIAEHLPETLSNLRRERSGFEERLQYRWAPALDLFEIVLVTSIESGSRFYEQNVESAVTNNDHTFEALVRIHARACAVSSEILALLKSGHADGAQARWRTLHELVVVAYFLESSAAGVSEKYLLHETIKSCDDAVDHDKFAGRLNHQPLSSEEREELKNRKTQLLAQYGEAYKGGYGWATAEVKRRDPHHKGRAVFWDLEEMVELDHWRPYYRFSSHAVHAGSKGTLYSLGLIEQNAMLVYGASNAGLSEPGSCACLSLLNVTTALLTYKPDPTTLALVNIVDQFATAASKLFVEIQEELVKEEESGV